MTMLRVNMARRLVAEGLGTALLLVAGSGITGERLSGGDVAIALLANALAAGAAPIALVSTFGPISGARLNPAVTLANASQGGLLWRKVPGQLASASFANPAVTLARSASDTFAGIRPVDTPGSIAAQCARAGASTLLFRWLVPSLPKDASAVVVPHPGSA